MQGPGLVMLLDVEKKLLKVLHTSKQIRIFAADNQIKLKIMKKKTTTPRAPGFVITGVNRLTGEREIISREMTYEQAINIMDREKCKIHRVWLRLKAERKIPRQLTIRIDEI